MRKYTSLQRTTLRKAIQAKRQALTPQEQIKAAQDVLLRFQTLNVIKSAHSIALYLSFDGELETQPLIEHCWGKNKDVYLPVIHPVCKGHLLFLRHRPGACLVQNQFGILEPKWDVRHVLPPLKLDVICTPLVAFDARGQRLGMGGGYYDRTLAPLVLKDPKVHFLGLAHDCQQVNLLPAQAWDVPLPEILTPSRHWRWAD